MSRGFLTVSVQNMLSLCRDPTDDGPSEEKRYVYGTGSSCLSGCLVQTARRSDPHFNLMKV